MGIFRSGQPRTFRGRARHLFGLGVSFWMLVWGSSVFANDQTAVGKNALPNQGVPLFVDVDKDLVQKNKSTLDSFYVNCSFDADGKQLGFEWHQMIYRFPQGSFSSSEFLLMNGSDDRFYPNTLAEPWNDGQGAQGQLMVSSSFGALQGDPKAMTLRLKTAKGQVNVTLKPRKQVLYNGTTGLLNLSGSKSYEYAYPNMDVEGTVTMEGHEYRLKNATAWFDRQWSGEVAASEDAAKMMSASWLWLGMPLNEDQSAAISLWDLYSDGGRNGFATILHSNGTQINVPAAVTYENVWTSAASGFQYPRKVHVSIPEESLDLTFTATITKPDFIHNDGKGAAGCQVLCNATGTYQGKPVHRNVIVEMIGNLCGK